jgi:hypothetical protein
MADVAFTFHFPPSELMELEVVELLGWHAQIGRLTRAVSGK